MSVRNFNNLTTIGTLVAPIAASVTTISVQSFSQAPPVPYTVTLDRNLATEEICLVTAQAGGSLTVVRGFDGTAGQSHTAGATIEHTAGAIEYSEANGHVNGTVGVHGTTGNLVGTEGAQSIFDKTLVAPLLQADVADGDAVVAYDPTGTRNLFRGMNQAGTNVITIDNTGKVNAGSLAVTGTAAVTGTSTLTGPLNANGGVTVPAGKTLTASGGITAASSSVTGNETVGGTLSVTGATTGTTITGSGLVKGAGVESTAGVTLAQIAAPSGVASKGQLWSQSDGGLYTRAGTNPAGRLPLHWGSGTAFPATGVLAGDMFVRTDVGTNGSLWRYFGGTIGSGGWLPDGPVICTSTTRPTGAVLYTGLEIVETDTHFDGYYDGTTWWYRSHHWGLTRYTGGTISQVMTAGQQSANQHITFPAGFFTVAPNVVISLADTANDYHWTWNADTISTTGFTARLLFNLPSGGAPLTAGVNACWFAFA